MPQVYWVACVGSPLADIRNVCMQYWVKLVWVGLLCRTRAYNQSAFNTSIGVDLILLSRALQNDRLGIEGASLGFL